MEVLLLFKVIFPLHLSYFCEWGPLVDYFYVVMSKCFVLLRGKYLVKSQLIWIFNFLDFFINSSWKQKNWYYHVIFLMAVSMVWPGFLHTQLSASSFCSTEKKWMFGCGLRHRVSWVLKPYVSDSKVAKQVTQLGLESKEYKKKIK